MGNARIVAGRRHLVVCTQIVVAPRQVLPGVAVEIAECSRQTIAAMLLGHTAERPQGVLQAFSQRHEALATQDYLGVREAGERHPEVIEPMRQRLA